MIYIFIVYASRVIKLKGSINQFLTKQDDRLSQSMPRYNDFNGQKISIHNRSVFFHYDDKEYILAMKNSDISVIFKPSKPKKVSFMSKKKPVDLFGLDRQTDKQDIKEKMEVKEDKAPKEFVDANEKYRVSSSKPQQKSIAENFFRRRVPIREEEKEEKVPDRTEVPENTEKYGKPEKVLPKKEVHHFIESDSNMSEIEDLEIKDVQIYELNADYFQLRSDKNCVTLFADKFIFAPCVKSESQYFTAVKIDELIKNHELEKEQVLKSLPVNMANKALESKETLSALPEIPVMTSNNLNESQQNKNQNYLMSKPFTSFSVSKEELPTIDNKEKKKETKKDINLLSKNEDTNSPAEMLERLKHTIEDAALTDF